MVVAPPENRQRLLKVVDVGGYLVHASRCPTRESPEITESQVFPQQHRPIFGCPTRESPEITESNNMFIF